MSAHTRVVFVLILMSFSALAAFAQGSGTAAASAPSPRMLEGLSPEAAMDLANAWGMNADENKMNIWTNSRGIHFEFPDGTKKVISLPADRMIISLAPYIMKTHPCKEHFPSSCRGELPNTPVEVKAVAQDGTVLIDKTTKTLPDGFVDLWLPRDMKIDVTLKARGLTVTQRVGTSDKDKTCITDPKLRPATGS